MDEEFVRSSHKLILR